MKKEENFSKLIIDGKIVNLKKASIEELQTLKGKLLNRQEELREKIDKIILD